MQKWLKAILLCLLLITGSACSFDHIEEEEDTAEEKGKLVLYSPNSDDLVDVAYAFGERYDIEVTVYSMGTGECLKQIVAEKDAPKADVLYGGLTYSNAYAYADYFEKYTAEGDVLLPEAYQNTNGVATHYCLDGSAALLINLNVFESLGLDPDDFTGYSDLLWPKLEGKIAMGDPTMSSSAWAELTNILLVMGEEPYDEKAWEFVKDLIDQIGQVEQSSSAIYRKTQNGDYAVGISYEDPCVDLIVNGANHIRIVYPEEGAVWLPAGAGIIKGCPNEENARKFIDWLISAEGQETIAETTARPVNTSINNTSTRMTPLSEINVVLEDMEMCTMHKEEWEKRWSELYAAAQSEEE